MRVYVGECASSHSVGRPRKRWVDTVKDCFKRRSLDVSQEERMVHHKREWRGFVREKCVGCSPGDEPLTLMRCPSCWLPQLYESLERGKSACDQAYNVRA